MQFLLRLASVNFIYVTVSKFTSTIYATFVANDELTNNPIKIKIRIHII
jgi:hypothetical protein